jgi:hypothetical protein
MNPSLDAYDSLSSQNPSYGISSSKLKYNLADEMERKLHMAVSDVGSPYDAYSSQYQSNWQSQNISRATSRKSRISFTVATMNFFVLVYWKTESTIINEYNQAECRFLFEKPK